MSFINSCTEQTEVRTGQFESRIGIKPICYDDRGTLRRNVYTFAQKGALDRPYVADQVPLWSECTPEGGARFLPTRDADVYAEFGAPKFKSGVDYAKPALGAASLARSQRVGWATANYDVEWVTGGHYVSWRLTPRRGWRAPESMLWPLVLKGLERKGDQFLSKGEPVCHLRAPIATDPNDPMGIVQLPHEWTVDGLVIDTSKAPEGWEIDPTLELQPDAAAGMDTFTNRPVAATNYATNTSIAVYESGVFQCIGLILFTLASLPAGAIIASSTCRLTTTAKPTANLTTTLSRILVANGAWTESEATWNYANTTTSTRWAGDVGADGGADAGCSQSGVDLSAVALSTVSALNNETIGTTHDCAFNLAEFALMQASNQGFCLISVGASYWYIASSDHATPAYRPALTVVYTLAGGGGARRMFIPDLGYFHARGA